MEKQEIQAFQIRIPIDVYNQIVKYREKKPYVSLNAFINEAVYQLLEKNRKEEKQNERKEDL